MQRASESATITVNYRLIEGVHVFTSNDVYGLYIACADPTNAYQALVPSIEKLLEMNEGLRCSVRPTMPLREFLDKLRGNPEVPHPAFLSTRQFVVESCN